MSKNISIDSLIKPSLAKTEKDFSKEGIIVSHPILADEKYHIFCNFKVKDKSLADVHHFVESNDIDCTINCALDSHTITLGISIDETNVTEAETKAKQIINKIWYQFVATAEQKEIFNRENTKDQLLNKIKNLDANTLLKG